MAVTHVEVVAVAHGVPGAAPGKKVMILMEVWCCLHAPLDPSCVSLVAVTIKLLYSLI